MAGKVGRPKLKTKTRRTPLRRRFTRKVRSTGKRKKGAKKHKKSLVTTVLAFVPILQGLQLLSENQVAQATTNEQKFKAFANAITGSLFDINFFKDAPEAHFNPSLEGGMNRWTFTNIGLIIGGMVGQHFKIKHASKLKNVGSASLIVSIITGVLGKKNNIKKSVFENPITVTSHSSGSGHLL